jgi:hypothetical protein
MNRETFGKQQKKNLKLSRKELLKEKTQGRKEKEIFYGFVKLLVKQLLLAAAMTYTILNFK